MRNLPVSQRRWVRFRLSLICLFLMVFASAVLVRAWQLQVIDGPELRALAHDQYLKNIKLAPKRGTVFDRHGAELAVSVEVDSVWANPRELKKQKKDPREVAMLLASVLDIDEERITKRLSRDRLFVWVKRRITPKIAAKVKALKLPGVHLEREARRFYPNRELAAHLLGFANIDGQGIEGLELSLEDRLRGSVKTVPAIRDRHGRVVFSEQLLDDRAAQGEDVTLTIDKTIQRSAERELELAVRTFEAQAGSVVVMDPKSGEILAIANYPTFNPNDPGGRPASFRRNRALTDRFEPGSTVKPFTIAAALGAGRVRADEEIDCENGAMEVAEYVIHDSHPYDKLTPAQVLQFSSNIGTAKIGTRLGRRGLYQAMRGFGFGQATGLPLPGETKGILRHHRRWYEMDAATIAFGQGMSVTSVQLASAMSALANGGKLMEPRLIRRFSGVRNETTEELLPRVRRQVVPRRTARLVSDMLTAVTGPGGTGLEAAVDGYLVAGKTGTAQKADYVAGGYADDRWLASFVGFVPAQDPRLVISVVIDEPIIAHYGGSVAGPVFRRVAQTSLQHLGIPADGAEDGLVRHARKRAERIALAKAKAEAEGVQYEAPEAPTEALVAITEGALEVGEVRIPDLTGVLARKAVSVLNGSGLNVSLSGSGVVFSQSPMAGSVVQKGSSVRVGLRSPTAVEDVLETVPEPETAQTVTPAASSGAT